MKLKYILQWVIFFGTIGTLSAQEDQRPNIIFLLSDDHTSIATGCYGNDQVVTPNMDKLAETGVQFMNHYNTTSICMASRAIYMTGMFEYKTGCNFEHGPMKKATFQQSFPMLLKDAGYFTGFAGKFGFAVSDGTDPSDKTWDVLPVDEFDVWAGGLGQTKYQTGRNKYLKKYADKYPHSTRAYAAWAHDFILEAKDSGKPFCMSISFKAPHLPFTPDVYFDAVYEGKTYKKPANYGAENATHIAPQAKTGRQYKQYEFWRDTEENYQEAIKRYNQLIHGVDYAIGMIRKSLEELGVDDNTIIIYAGDNGYSCGAHNLGGKVLPYEEPSKSPLLIYDPRMTSKGGKRETITSSIDIAPTILTMAGITVPNHIDGENLIPLMQKKKGIKRDHIPLMNFFGNDEIQEMAVVTKDWKYIYWQYEDERMQPTEELYYIGKDRLEMTNVISEKKYKKQLNKMRTLYDAQVKQLKDNAVPYHDYQKYGVLFDRNSSIEDKQPYLRGTYEEQMKGKTPKNHFN
ncbi:sulfatase family protein [Flammeovirga agarivorans]|uniref:Sulfatase n=1 Tax=Flammeovirga agarivorans TaxID=2726742 RepID=A0A7X8SKC2_9BACT|nr:sulfatase [Flammeovirga agarivorans]NLR91826.1 sulfatase [Flammeovirga agarivorans]